MHVGVRVRNALSGELSWVPRTWLEHFPHLQPVDDDEPEADVDPPNAQVLKPPIAIDEAAVTGTPADLPAPPEETPTTNHARSGSHRSGWED